MLRHDGFTLQIQTIPESEESVYICACENFDKTCQPVTEEKNDFFFSSSVVP